MAGVDTSGLTDAVTRYAEEVCEGAARQALDTVRSGVPQGETGELRASEFDRSSGLTIDIGYEAEHASFTDEGTSPHPIPTPVAFEGDGGFVVIVPDSRSGGVQAFESDDGTLVIMGMPFINHPGNAGTGWWTDIIGTDGEGLLEILQEVASITTVSA